MKQLLLFFSIVFLLACEEDEYTYSGKYISENMYFSAVKVYTTNGEITDAYTIEQAVYNHFPNEFTLNSDTVLEAEGIIDIEFLSGEKANVNYGNIAEERDVKEKNGVLYVESAGISRFYDSDDETIWKQISKYKPLYSNTQTAPSSSGFVTYTDYKHCLFLLQYEAKIKVPFLTYVLVRHPSQDNIQVEAGVKNNNSFNNKALDYLVSGDTLIVQEYYIKLIKQQ
jgi:hypothetical protein